MPDVLETDCPNCGKKTIYSEKNPDRPFCSNRCKLIDLGQWASDGYKFETEEKLTPSADDEEIY